MTRVNQGLFSTTMEAEKRDPGNEVGTLFVFPGIWEIRDDRSVSRPFFTILAPFTAWNTR